MTEKKFDFIRYANCWEDTDNLFRSLEIEGRRGVSVLSAGDNTLALLLKNPEKITAVDINKTQIHLFNLKKAGIKKLCYEDFIALLGVFGADRSYELFRTLRDVMEPQAFEYFEKNKGFFKKGIVNIGKFENYFRLFRRYAIPLFSTKKRFIKLASFSDVEAQAEFYRKIINKRRMNMVFRAFFGFRVMGKLGRDKSFYDYVDDRKESGRNIKEIVDYGLTHIPNSCNPYIRFICTGGYGKGCLPEYLRRENFDIIRNRIDRIEIRCCDLSEIDGRYGFYNLSDIFEYMSDEEFGKCVDRIYETAEDGATLAYYNMQNKRYINDGRFVPLTNISHLCTRDNRAYFYRDFLAYRKKNPNE